MKIVCDACSAKYSIADDKVKGKVFKIRCKKCSNIIVVRGNAGAGAAAGGGADDAPAAYDQKETRVYDYQGYDDAGGPAADEAVWHLVIDQEQVGPIAATEVQRRFSGGEIDGDTYIWREGFGDWQPLSAVDAFAPLFSGGAAALPAARADAGFGGAPDEGGTARSDPGDLFAGAGVGADEPADDAGSDLFGGAARSGKAAAAGGDAALFGGGGGGGGAVPAEKAAKAAADKRLRGERNENSVLFSLNNLAALASDAPRTVAPTSSSASSGGSASMAAASTSSSGTGGGGEGSGLIDIRSMASTYLSDKGSPKSKASGIGSADDLPVFSSSAFHEPAVIMPSPSSSGQTNKLLYALIGVVALLAIVAVVLVVVVFAGKKSPEVAVAAPPAGGTVAGGAPVTPPGETKPPGDQAAVPPVKADEPPVKADEPPKADEPKAPVKADEPAKADKPKTDHKSSGKSSGKSDEPKADKPDKPAKPEPKDTSSSGGGGCMDEVGCLLADHPPACCSKYGGTKKSGGGAKTGGGGGDSSLPEELDRAMISTGVGKVRGRIEACGGKSSAKGEVKVSVKVAAGGSVSSVSVKSSPDPSLGACVAAAMEKASFSKTQNGGSFSYPFIFR